MAKKRSEGVYRIVDVVGVSKTSWEDAGRRAVETAATSLRDLRVAEVTKMDMTVDNGKVSAFRTRVALSFKYEPDGFAARRCRSAPAAPRRRVRRGHDATPGRRHTLIFSSSSTRATAGRFFMRSLNAV